MNQGNSKITKINIDQATPKVLNKSSRGSRGTPRQRGRTSRLRRETRPFRSDVPELNEHRVLQWLESLPGLPSKTFLSAVQRKLQIDVCIDKQDKSILSDDTLVYRGLDLFKVEESSKKTRLALKEALLSSKDERIRAFIKKHPSVKVLETLTLSQMKGKVISNDLSISLRKSEHPLDIPSDAEGLLDLLWDDKSLKSNSPPKGAD